MYWVVFLWLAIASLLYQRKIIQLIFIQAKLRSGGCKLFVALSYNLFSWIEITIHADF